MMSASMACTLQVDTCGTCWRQRAGVPVLPGILTLYYALPTSGRQRCGPAGLPCLWPACCTQLTSRLLTHPHPSIVCLLMQAHQPAWPRCALPSAQALGAAALQRAGAEAGWRAGVQAAPRQRGLRLKLSVCGWSSSCCCSAGVSMARRQPLWLEQSPLLCSSWAFPANRMP